MTTIEFNHQIIGYQRGLQSYAYSLVLNKDDAHDLVQETYLKALSFYHKLADFSNIKAWLGTIMRNIFINNYRRNNKTRDMVSEKLALQKDFEMGFEHIDSYYSQNEINKAVEKLNDELKQSFLMFVDGFKYREIAEETGINIGTVKSRIFTARQQLTQTLKDFR